MTSLTGVAAGAGAGAGVEWREKRGRGVGGRKEEEYGFKEPGAKNTENLKHQRTTPFRAQRQKIPSIPPPKNAQPLQVLYT